MTQALYGKKILIANVPLDGHFNPLTGLAKHLQHIGCDVRWYTSETFSERLNKLDIPHYPFIKALELSGQNLGTIIPEIKTAAGPQKGRLYLKNLFIDRATEYFEDISEIFNDFSFDLLIADSMFSAMPLIRYKLGVPVVAIGIVPLMEDSIDIAPAGQALPPAKNEAIRLAYAKMYANKYKNIADLIEKYTSDLKIYGVSVSGSFIFDTLIKEANIYLQIGVPGFEYERSDQGKNVRFVGSLLPYSSPNGRPKWTDPRLKEFDKIIFVTQGTVERDVKKLLEPTLEAFVGSDTLVIAATGGNATLALRKKYQAPNIIIEDFIPFEDIMPHVSVFITNGGYGGTMLSIMHGVPIIAAGVYELKNEICSRIEYFGLGMDLKTETPSTEIIYQSARQVIMNDFYKDKVMALRDEINQYDSLALCTRYIDQLLNTNCGSDSISAPI